MNARTLYQVRKSHIKDIDALNTFHCERAFREGYVFVRVVGDCNEKGSVYILSTTKSKQILKSQLVENIEIVSEHNEIGDSYIAKALRGEVL